MPQCKICRISDDTESYTCFDDVYNIYLCSLCRNQSGKQKWGFKEAWSYRYSHGYRSKKREYTSVRAYQCYYCGTEGYHYDCNGKKHANPIDHRFKGQWECQYCEYDRQVVQPRHDKIMSDPKSYSGKDQLEFYKAHTFGGSGSSGINPEKAIQRIMAEKEKRKSDFERRQMAFKSRQE